MLTIDKINQLQQQIEIVTRQYNSLLKQYNSVLQAAKENADSNEFCLKELEGKYEIAFGTLVKIAESRNYDFKNRGQMSDSLQQWAKEAVQKIIGE